MRQRPDTPVSVRAAGLDLLARREYSFDEMFRRLVRRFGDADLVQEQLQKLTDEGLQSDGRFAEVFVRSQISKSRGPVRIKAAMRQRGLSAGLIDSALAEADVDWFDLIQVLNQRKFGDSPPRDQKERARRLRFFQYRGFAASHIDAVLR